MVENHPVSNYDLKCQQVSSEEVNPYMTSLSVVVPMKEEHMALPVCHAYKQLAKSL